MINRNEEPCRKMSTGRREHVHERINANSQLTGKNKSAFSGILKKIRMHTLNLLNSHCWHGLGIDIFFSLGNPEWCKLSGSPSSNMCQKR